MATSFLLSTLAVQPAFEDITEMDFVERAKQLRMVGLLGSSSPPTKQQLIEGMKSTWLSQRQEKHTMH
jgi:hypothetical protein